MSDLVSTSSYVERIAAIWRRTQDGIFEIGNLLLEAKEALPHGAFGEMVRAELPFGERYAQHFMAIARDERFSNPKLTSHLPASAETLYELTKLDDVSFERLVKDKSISPALTQAEARRIVQEVRKAPARQAFAERVDAGCTVEDLRRIVSRGTKFGAIMADPPWHYGTWSEAGEGRSASQHYKTDRELEETIALPVADLAADNCVLFLWIMDWDPELVMARAVIEAWGFAHKTTAFTWVKLNGSGEGYFLGQGKWTRANPETCLLATRGKPSPLAHDVRQLIVTPIGEHSRKPDEAYEGVERLVAGPYLELFGRRQRPGWTSWGNEIPRADFDAMVEAEEGAIEIPRFKRRAP